MRGGSASSQRIKPIRGWFLERIVAIDVHSPGLTGHVFRGSTERRHVIASYLSLQTPFSDFRSDKETGWFLASAGHDCLLRAAFGTVPPGYRAALGRVVDEVQDRRFYRYLRRLISKDADDRSLQTLLHRLHDFDFLQLRMARALPPDLRNVRLIGNLCSLKHAADVARVASLLENVGIDRAALAHALGSVANAADVSRTIRRWAFKASLPPHPVPAADGYDPIITGEALRRAALRYRNCMRSYLATVLDGDAAFAIVRDGKHEAVAHLVRKGEAWQLDRLHGTMIAAVPPALRLKTEAYLASHNICSRRKSTIKRMYDPLRNLIGGFDSDRDGD